MDTTTDTNTLQTEVTAFLGRVRQSWDNADAHAYAQEFAENASYVIFMGDALLGRTEIEETHRDVFTKWQKGTRMIVKPISVQPINDSTVSVVTAGGIGKGSRIDYDKLQTYVLHKEEGRWICVSFQNTEMSSRAKKAYNQ